MLNVAKVNEQAARCACEWVVSIPARVATGCDSCRARRAACSSRTRAVRNARVVDTAHCSARASYTGQDQACVYRSFLMHTGASGRCRPPCR